MSQRERLDQLWRIFAHFILIFSILILILSFLLKDEGPSLVRMVRTFSLSVLPIGVIVALPNFRVRAQAYGALLMTGGLRVRRGSG